MGCWLGQRLRTWADTWRIPSSESRGGPPVHGDSFPTFASVRLPDMDHTLSQQSLPTWATETVRGCVKQAIWHRSRRCKMSEEREAGERLVLEERERELAELVGLRVRADVRRKGVAGCVRARELERAEQERASISASIKSARRRETKRESKRARAREQERERAREQASKRADLLKAHVLFAEVDIVVAGLNLGLRAPDLVFDGVDLKLVDPAPPPRAVAPLLHLRHLVRPARPTRAPLSTDPSLLESSSSRFPLFHIATRSAFKSLTLSALWNSRALARRFARAVFSLLVSCSLPTLSLPLLSSVPLPPSPRPPSCLPPSPLLCTFPPPLLCTFPSPLLCTCRCLLWCRHLLCPASTKMKLPMTIA
eukprot:3931946-Rhodomonas_salina.2